MAKGQKRSSKEIKKPKTKKDAVVASSVSLIARATGTPPLPKKKG